MFKSALLILAFSAAWTSDGFVLPHFRKPWFVLKEKPVPLPSWIDKDYVVDDDNCLPDPEHSVSLFDRLNADHLAGSHRYAIAPFSLSAISEAFHFSLAYLGDTCMQLGCPSPLDIDTPICNFMTDDQICSLTHVLNSLDAFDASQDYDTLSVAELAEEMDVPLDQLMKLCTLEKVNLPFGVDTNLHESAVKRLTELVTATEKETKA